MKQIVKGSAPDFLNTSSLKKKQPKTWEELGITRKEQREHIIEVHK